MFGPWRQSRSWRGGPFGAGPRWLQRFDSVVELLLWVNIGLFLLQFLLGARLERLLALSADGLGSGYVWQPVTYMFLHDRQYLFHILVNMLMLWFFGREVESFIGSRHFTKLYFFGGLAGAFLWLAFNFHSHAWVLGASGAVLALVVAFATLFPEREITLLLFFILPVRMKAKYLAIGAVAIDALLLLGGHRGVAHLAHLGGAGLGYVYIKALGYGAAPRWVLWFRDLGTKLRPRPRSGGRRPPARGGRSVEDYMREEIDPILDKISREGLHSLTKAERKILESARDLMEKRRR